MVHWYPSVLVANTPTAPRVDSWPVNITVFIQPWFPFLPIATILWCHDVDLGCDRCILLHPREVLRHMRTNPLTLFSYRQLNDYVDTVLLDELEVSLIWLVFLNSSNGELCGTDIVGLGRLL